MALLILIMISGTVVQNYREFIAGELSLLEYAGVVLGLLVAVVGIVVSFKKLIIKIDFTSSVLDYSYFSLVRPIKTKVAFSQATTVVFDIGGRGGTQMPGIRPMLVASDQRLPLSLRYSTNTAEAESCVRKLEDLLSVDFGDLLEKSLADLLAQKRKLDAIMLLRVVAGFGLREATEYVKKFKESPA